ncbi:STAS domain-containing protein [Psychrobacillus sp. NPDC058041]|uniref:STAS domain-containing protein n=1 Tax=Psychrobacillus sp. NPDC058041 TaxID=3346310 RepID=UPI0036DF5487
MDGIKKVGQYLIENAEKIAREMIDLAIEHVNYQVTNEMLEQSIKNNVDFLELLANSFNETNDTAAEELIKWSKKNGEQQAAVFTQFSKIIKPYAKNRLMYLEYITKISIELGLSTEEVVKINNRICYLMDVSMAETMIAYETYRDELMSERKKEINKLSAPIVPIQKGIAILPLVGDINYERVQHLLDYVVPTMPDFEIDHLIIDFSGILMIDTEIAQHIFTIHNVLELLGIHVMFTGIRPNLSMVIVRAGIDFTSFHTFGSVKHAIDSLEKNILSK